MGQSDVGLGHLKKCGFWPSSEINLNLKTGHLVNKSPGIVVQLTPHSVSTNCEAHQIDFVPSHKLIELKCSENIKFLLKK